MMLKRPQALNCSLWADEPAIDPIKKSKTSTNVSSHDIVNSSLTSNTSGRGTRIDSQNELGGDFFQRFKTQLCTCTEGCPFNNRPNVYLNHPSYFIIRRERSARSKLRFCSQLSSVVPKEPGCWNADRYRNEAQERITPSIAQAIIERRSKQWEAKAR